MPAQRYSDDPQCTRPDRRHQFASGLDDAGCVYCGKTRADLGLQMSVASSPESLRVVVPAATIAQREVFDFISALGFDPYEVREVRIHPYFVAVDVLARGNNDLPIRGDDHDGALHTIAVQITDRV